MVEGEDQPRIVRRGVWSKSAKLCPKCLSRLSRGSKFGGWLIPQDYYCENCGYKGHAYLEARSIENDQGTSNDT